LNVADRVVPSIILKRVQLADNTEHLWRLEVLLAFPDTIAVIVAFLLCLL